MANAGALRGALKWTGLALGLAVLFLLGFGISGEDAARYRTFVDKVEQWQSNPEFRSVGYEYADYSGDVLRTRPYGVPALKLIMALRSIPLLPERLAVAPTSLKHYTSFTRGPLSAYLHLSGEQGLEGVLSAVERMGGRADLGDEEVRVFLDTFNLDPPTARDDGAVRSVRMLLADIEASRPLVVRTRTHRLILPILESLLREMDLPTDPALLSLAQQQAAVQRLDAEVRRVDPELWRTKQLNDFLSGVWAQSFGLTYTWLVRPILAARMFCRVAGPLLLLAVVLRAAWRRHPVPAEALSPPVEAAH